MCCFKTERHVGTKLSTAAPLFSIAITNVMLPTNAVKKERYKDASSKADTGVWSTICSVPDLVVVWKVTKLVFE